MKAKRRIESSPNSGTMLDGTWGHVRATMPLRIVSGSSEGHARRHARVLGGPLADGRVKLGKSDVRFHRLLPRALSIRRHHALSEIDDSSLVTL